MSVRKPPLTLVLDLVMRTACSATLFEDVTVKSAAYRRNLVPGL
jgi:hypothetical protein